MLPDRTFSPAPSAVTLVQLDGQSHRGYLSRFCPQSPDITLLLNPTTKARSSFAAEHLAMVGFHRPSGRPPRRQGDRQAMLKVHIAGGTTFLVDPVEPQSPGGVGMYALPAEPDCPYREIFFYNHAVNLRELNEPLGSLLLKDHQLPESALQRGLDAQKQQNRTPLGEILVEHKRIGAGDLKEATALQARRGTRIGEVLIEAGMAKEGDIEFALKEQRKRGGKRIGQILVDLNVITEVDLARALARKFQLPFVDLDKCSINLDAVRELPRDFIEKHSLLPVDTEPRIITVALSDPLAVDVLDQVRIHARKRLSEVVVTQSQLRAQIPRYLDRLAAREREGEMDEILKGLENAEAELSEEGEAEPERVDESDNSIIKLANQIIIDAYRRGASDIHIEPNGAKERISVRVRVDGECLAYQDIPAAYRLPLVARMKIMAQLDMTERRKPQDGKIRFKVGERRVELRVATIPTVNNNEDIVLRILAGSKPIELESMGLSARNLAETRRLAKQPYGLLLCVGPTGSGKTTTLHSVLGSINNIGTKIWTAEDPVEITQSGLRQVQVNPKIGFTFAAAMRAFLRADPDVIMVGEMRDEETAKTAIEASLTGHLVLSTLHTNSAPETITRLTDMGLDPFSFADALLGVMAQRLARGLCRQCRQSYNPSAREMEELAEYYGRDAFVALLERLGEDPVLWAPVGCNACGQSGYKGRVAIHELLVNDSQVKRTVQKRLPVDDVRGAASEGGMTTLLQDGLEKVLSGQTDLKQVLAVCSR